MFLSKGTFEIYMEDFEIKIEYNTKINKIHSYYFIINYNINKV